MDDKATGMRIKVTAAGPYLVSGSVPLIRMRIICNDAGEAIAWEETERLPDKERYVLCRCGHSEGKPYCDGSHTDVAWDGEETAGHHSYFESAEEITGPDATLHDARPLCANARFCLPGGGLWHLIDRCDDPDVMAQVKQEARDCPSGRYTIRDKHTNEVDEPNLEPAIALVDDPDKGVAGPLWVRGGIEVVDAEGNPYERRNRVTLCRCGQSDNKPFCDGSHIASGFTE